MHPLLSPLPASSDSWAADAEKEFERRTSDPPMAPSPGPRVPSPQPIPAPDDSEGAVNTSHPLLLAERHTRFSSKSNSPVPRNERDLPLRQYRSQEAVRRSIFSPSDEKEVFVPPKRSSSLVYSHLDRDPSAVINSSTSLPLANTLSPPPKSSSAAPSPLMSPRLSDPSPLNPPMSSNPRKPLLSRTRPRNNPSPPPLPVPPALLLQPSPAAGPPLSLTPRAHQTSPPPTRTSIPIATPGPLPIPIANPRSPSQITPLSTLILFPPPPSLTSSLRLHRQLLLVAALALHPTKGRVATTALPKSILVLSASFPRLQPLQAPAAAQRLLSTSRATDREVSLRPPQQVSHR